MEAKYVPFKKAIAKTLIAGMLLSTFPKISSGEITAKTDFDKNQASVGIQYSMKFGNTKSDYQRDEPASIEKKVDGKKSSEEMPYEDTEFKDFDEKRVDYKPLEITGFEKRMLGEKKDIYASNNFSGFVWGLTKPFQLYNYDSNKGFQLYPFLLKPFKVGGIFSPFVPNSWKRKNLSITAGTLISEAALIIAGILSSKKKQQNSNSYDNGSGSSQTSDSGSGDGGGGGGDGGQGGDL